MIPVSAVFANIFMSYYEKQWLESCPDDFKPILYKRYVDDTYMIFRSESHVEPFFQFLNSKHRNIRFTIERESEGKIPFLDILIQKKDGRFDFSMFRKPTFTGLGLNFLSECFHQYKINSIKTLIYRAYNLSSSYFNFHNEILFLKQYFNNNGFNSDLFYNIVNRFLSSVYVDKPKVEGPEKKVIYIRFPLLSKESNKLLSDKLKKLLQINAPQINLKLAFFNNHKIRTYFKHKDSLPTALRSLVVYCFTCAKCSLAYIGSTKKMLTLRVDEHRGFSSRTGRPIQNPHFSTVRNHCLDTCNICFDLTDFKILTKCQTETELRIAETILIKMKRPVLNVENSDFNLKIF